jgi:hypothetical protein
MMRVCGSMGAMKLEVGCQLTQSKAQHVSIGIVA